MKKTESSIPVFISNLKLNKNFLYIIIISQQYISNES